MWLHQLPKHINQRGPVGKVIVKILCLLKGDVATVHQDIFNEVPMLLCHITKGAVF